MDIINGIFGIAFILVIVLIVLVVIASWVLSRKSEKDYKASIINLLLNNKKKDTELLDSINNNLLILYP